MISKLLLSLFIHDFLQHCFHSEQHIFLLEQTVFNILQTFQTDLFQSSTKYSLVIHNYCSVYYPVLFHLPCPRFKNTTDVNYWLYICQLCSYMFPNIATTTMFRVHSCELTKCELFLPEHLMSGPTMVNIRLCYNFQEICVHHTI